MHASKAVRCSSVEEAGADLGEVERWVEGVEGWREEVVISRSTQLMAGKQIQNPLPPACYFVVALEALRNG